MMKESSSPRWRESGDEKINNGRRRVAHVRLARNARIVPPPHTHKPPVASTLATGARAADLGRRNGCTRTTSQQKRSRCPFTKRSRVGKARSGEFDGQMCTFSTVVQKNRANNPEIRCNGGGEGLNPHDPALLEKGLGSDCNMVHTALLTPQPTILSLGTKNPPRVGDLGSQGSRLRR
jgi:hypothetical protein